MKQTVLFLGNGIMGSNIIKHLQNYTVFVFCRKEQKSDDNVCYIHSINDFPNKIDYIISCLPDDETCINIWVNPIVQQIIQHNKCVCIEHTTLSCQGLEIIANVVENCGGTFIECPITGSKVGAENGKLCGFINTHKKVDILTEYIKKFYIFNSLGQATKYKLMYNLWGLMYLYFFSEFLPIIKNEFEENEITVVLQALKECGPMSSICISKLDSIYSNDFDDVHFKFSNMLKDVKYAEKTFKMYNLPITHQISKLYDVYLKQNTSYRNKDYTIVSTMYMKERKY